jgi:hypothetical protein
MLSQANKDASPELGGTTHVLGDNLFPITSLDKAPKFAGNVEYMSFMTLSSEKEAAEWVVKKHHEIANRINKQA